MIKNSLFLFVIMLFSFAVSAQQKLTPVDTVSKVHFLIRNFGINTGGDLSGLKGQIVFDTKNPANSKFDISVDVATIDTDNKRRDNHLRNDDYFDVAKYPRIAIIGKPVFVSGNSWILKGMLTIKDVTNPIEIPFTATPQPSGFLFEGAFTINRLHYHVGGESATMSDEVNVTLKILAK
ncbi:MAG TPA: YceI family protein [Ferruginibacter sp.]|nr:YceI family protein [Ferruginibacter sp.]